MGWEVVFGLVLTDDVTCLYIVDRSAFKDYCLYLFIIKLGMVWMTFKGD